MKPLPAFTVIAAIALASDSRGLKPRPAPGDYPSQETSRDFTLAATVLTPEQVKATFSTELKDYLVLEVGIYPGAGQRVEVASSDFALRFGEGNIVRAAAPRAIASSNQRKNAPAPPPGGRDITVYPTATVGVGSGTDPITGRRGTGVYTGAGVGVGVGGGGGPAGPPPPASTDRDRGVMQQELTDLALPDGQTAAPVAGYLYFPLPVKARNAALELQYYAAAGKVRLALPAIPRGK